MYYLIVKKANLLVLFIITMFAFLVSCSDFLEPVVEQEKESKPESFSSVLELQSLVYDVYDEMRNSSYYGFNYVLSSEVATDNAFSNGQSGRLQNEAKLTLTVTSGTAASIWSRIYRVIARCNLAISITSDEVYNDVRAQAYALRALAYFDLLRRFGQDYVSAGVNPGGIPIVTTFADKSNFFPARSSIEDVRKRIEEDLKQAETLIDPAVKTKTRINKGAVYALQSRYYIYAKKWSEAKAAAKKLIDSKDYVLPAKDSYLSEWKTNEAASTIFELGIVDAEALGVYHMSGLLLNTSFGDAQPTNELYNLYENDDIRKSAYTQFSDDEYRLTGKYTNRRGVDHIILFRYAEVLLNYAEASYHLSEADALENLNVIPKARGGK